MKKVGLMWDFEPTFSAFIANMLPAALMKTARYTLLFVSIKVVNPLK